MSTISTGLSRCGIGVLGAIALLVAATACSSSGGGSKAAAPAERHLVYVAGEPEATPDATAAKASVWIADQNGAHARRLTKGFVGLLSPDGRSVAVQRKGQGIFLISSDGKQSRRLTASPRLRPQAWSADSSTLYATIATDQAVVELDAIDRDSGKLHTVARGSLYGLDTSPDGKQLVYSRAPVATDQGICGDQFDLYVSKLDGSGAKRITSDGLSAFPVWVLVGSPSRTSPSPRAASPIAARRESRRSTPTAPITRSWSTVRPTRSRSWASTASSRSRGSARASS